MEGKNVSVAAENMKFCKHCGQKIREEAVICPHCGCQVEEIRKQTTRRRRLSSTTPTTIPTS